MFSIRQKEYRENKRLYPKAIAALEALGPDKYKQWLKETARGIKTIKLLANGQDVSHLDWSYPAEITLFLDKTYDKETLKQLAEFAMRIPWNQLEN